MGIRRLDCIAWRMSMVLTLLGATASQAWAVASYEVTSRTFDTHAPYVVCNDFFCNSVTVIPPASVTDHRAGTLTPSELTFVQLFKVAETRIGSASSEARTSIGGWTSATMLAGVAASAAKTGDVVGVARAAVHTEFAIRVEISFPVTSIAGALLNAASQSLCQTGCRLATDFQHQTFGTFSYGGSPGPGSYARFSETVAMDSGGGLSGKAFIAAAPASADPPEPSASGAFQLPDFLPTVTEAGRTRTTFNHFESIEEQVGIFFAAPDFIVGEYRIAIDQVAEAGFATPPLDYGAGSIEADFAHTSTFGFSGLRDPSGTLDFSQAQISVTVIDVSPVPEPAEWMFLAAGLGIVFLRTARCRPLQPAHG